MEHGTKQTGDLKVPEWDRLVVTGNWSPNCPLCPSPSCEWVLLASEIDEHVFSF